MITRVKRLGGVGTSEERHRRNPVDRQATSRKQRFHSSRVRGLADERFFRLSRQSHKFDASLLVYAKVCTGTVSARSSSLAALLDRIEFAHCESPIGS